MSGVVDWGHRAGVWDWVGQACGLDRCQGARRNFDAAPQCVVRGIVLEDLAVTVLRTEHYVLYLLYSKCRPSLAGALRRDGSDGHHMRQPQTTAIISPAGHASYTIITFSGCRCIITIFSFSVRCLYVEQACCRVCACTDIRIRRA